MRINQSMSLLEALQLFLPDSSQTKRKKSITQGRIYVNNTAILDPRAILREGDILSLKKKEFEEPLAYNIRLVYEDAHFIVVEKPAGLLSVAKDTGTQDSVHKAIKRRYKKKVFVIHRLDQATSGLIVFALDQNAFQLLKEALSQRLVKREYYGVVEGTLKERQGTWTWYLREDANYTVWASSKEDEGVFSRTHYFKETFTKDYSLVRFTLDTGKKNQIRIHCKMAGHPIAGDKKYGALTDPIQRVALHAAHLSFTHPITKKDLSFSSPVPKNFLKLVKK